MRGAAMITVGFTGTRNGMTPRQGAGVRNLLTTFLERDAVTLVHGDCIGADAEVHAIALELRELGGPIRIEIHPCDFPDMRAHCQGGHVHPFTTPFRRNRHIVQVSSVMIAAPATADEQPRGGTWYTIRYSREIGRRIFVVAPDGNYHHTPARDASR